MSLYRNMSLECVWVDMERVLCNDTLFIHDVHAVTFGDDWFWIFIGIYVGLVLMAGVFSGLCLGLLSLDLTTLRVLKDAGKPSESRYAAKIIPLVQRHHLLLVTLLLANTFCVEAMPIFLDKISDPFTAIAVSVSAVLVFGEILPQSVCTRYGLAVGATLAPVVYILMALLFVIAYPLAKILDCFLGQEYGTYYRRAELKALVALHGSGDANLNNNTFQRTIAEGEEDQLTKDEVIIIKGVLDMRDKTVRHAMIPVHDVFMLSIDDCLDEETMLKIQDSSYSRIPVYEGTFHQVVGVLMVKALIKVDVRTPLPIRSLQGSRSLRPPHFVADNMSLFDLMNHFQTGKNHLSVVHVSDTWYQSGSKMPAPLPNELLRKLVIGIITLEDIIEELLQEEIFDETDLYIDDVQRMLNLAIKKTVSRDSREIKRSDLSDQCDVSTVCDVRSVTPLLKNYSFA